MHRGNAVLLGVLAVLLLPLHLFAQERGGLRLTPHAGVYVPLNEIGAAAPAQGPWFLHLGKADPTVSVGMTAEWDLQGAPLGFRIGALYALPTQAEGFFNCYPGLACPAVLLESSADVSVIAGLADVVWSPRVDAGVRPYALAGFGLKRYAYEWPDAATFVGAGSHSETGAALHLGIGATFDLFGGSFRAEAGDIWSGQGNALGTATGSGADLPRRNAQHDISVTLGWRVLRF